MKKKKLRQLVNDQLTACFPQEVNALDILEEKVMNEYFDSMECVKDNKVHRGNLSIAFTKADIYLWKKRWSSGPYKTMSDLSTETTPTTTKMATLTHFFKEDFIIG